MLQQQQQRQRQPQPQQQQEEEEQAQKCDKHMCGKSKIVTRWQDHHTVLCTWAHVQSNTKTHTILYITLMASLVCEALQLLLLCHIVPIITTTIIIPHHSSSSSLPYSEAGGQKLRHPEFIWNESGDQSPWASHVELELSLELTRQSERHKT